MQSLCGSLPWPCLDAEKVWYRGVEKNKLVFKRCRPVMARYLGCGICMKVCPIQKYGMQPVMEHYVATGQILARGPIIWKATRSG